MDRSLALVLALFSIHSAAAGELIPPTLVTLPAGDYTQGDMVERLGELTKIKTRWETPKVRNWNHFAFDKVPAWTAIETVAAKLNAKIVLEDEGKSITLRDGPSAISFVDGAFRIVAKGVGVNSEFEFQRVGYSIPILVHWEPRLMLFSHGYPHITEAIDDRGVKLTGSTHRNNYPISPEYSKFNSQIEVKGLTRESKRIAKLEGTVAVIACPKMLAFAFDELNKLPVNQEQETVRVTVTKMHMISEVFTIEVHLEYPEGTPKFDNFKNWANSTKLKLSSPDRKKTLEPVSHIFTSQGRTLTCVYRFLKAAIPANFGNGVEWTLTYDTPAPMTEYDVKFSLKDLLLP